MRGLHSPARRPLSRRAKVVAAAATATVVAAGTLTYFAAFPQKAPAFVRHAMSSVGLPVADARPEPPRPTCPLTGEVARGGVPQRPVLAVKVENYPDARPQAGLQSADIVYEEPVEGGITRFIALFQCSGVDRVGPVRSVRTTDPKVLSQFGVPILAFSGGAADVVRIVERANLVPVDETRGGTAFSRDDSRPSPHNLYVDPRALYRVAQDGRRPPSPVFAYADEIDGRSRRVSSIHLPFSSTYADVYWAWSRKAGEWRRSHGDVPHVDESGDPISAANVIVQMVPVVIGLHGGVSPYLDLTGAGRAYVFRDGRMIVGRWERRSPHDVTTFVTRDGQEIAMAPGRTWVELFPDDVAIETSR